MSIVTSAPVPYQPSFNTDSKDQNLLGIWTLLWLMLALGYAVYSYNGLSQMQDINLLLSGNLKSLEYTTDNAYVTVVTSIFVDVILSLGILFSVMTLLKPQQGHSATDVLGEMKLGRNFQSFFMFVLIEEIIARWFFLGFLGSFYPESNAWLYAMFLIGNSLWSLVHLANYKNPEDRHLIRVLPQFVGGVIFSYVYLKHGLFMSVLAHMGSNAVIFSMHKKETVFPFISTIYLVIVFSICTYNFDKSYVSAQDWFLSGSQEISPIPGWEFWDYFLLMVTAVVASSFVCNFLLFDSDGDKSDIKKVSAVGLLTSLSFACVIVILIVCLLYYFASIFFSNFAYKAMFVAVVIQFMMTSHSGSSVARSFFLLPTGYLFVCIIEVAGFWSSFGVFFLTSLILMPYVYLSKAEHA